MAHLLLTNHNHHQIINRGIRKRAVTRTFRIGNYSLLFMMTLFVGIVTLLYLFHFNKFSTKGYYLNYLEAQRQELVGNNEIHLMRLAEVSSLDYIKNSPKAQMMVKAPKPLYVSGNTEMAKR